LKKLKELNPREEIKKTSTQVAIFGIQVSESSKWCKIWTRVDTGH